MDAEFETAPIAKKAREEIIDLNKCVFCEKKFSAKCPAVTPVLSKLQSLFSACRQRNDTVGKLLLANESDITSGKVPFRYHRNCKSTYVSKWHVKLVVADVNVGEGSSRDSTGDGAVKSFTRSHALATSFDWQNRCFICGEACPQKHRQTWSMVESSVKYDPASPNIYARVLEAAKIKQDDDMLTRLQGVPNGDLVAVEARYHRQKSCYIKYVSPQNVSLKQKRNQQFTAHNTAVRKLISELIPPVLEHNQVFFLSTLRQRFLEIMVDEGVDQPESYTSQHLKRQLIKEWSDVAFIPQPGKSDLVCSRTTTVGDALRKASELSQVLKELTEDEPHPAEESPMMYSVAEDSIVHQAMGILRKGLMQVQKMDDEYYSSAEMSVKAQLEFVDPLLYKAIGWLTDEALYTEAADISDVQPANVKCLNIACDIVTLATSVPSPKHLGLAARLHHGYGSRQLVDEMYHMGYSISYTEIRQFQTSAAHYICEQQTPTTSGAYIPPEITPRDNGGQLIVAVADNWDHNERTTDGKRTTHAMTSILVQRKQEQSHEESFRFKRVASRTFDPNIIPGGNLSNVQPYRKPTKRPEPKFEPPVLTTEVKMEHESSDVTKAKAIELVYTIARSGLFSHKATEDTIPPWGVFHVGTEAESSPAVSTVAFNPILMAAPTDLSTVYTTLKRAKEAINSLGQPYAPVYFDMGLLTKAYEITWANPDDLNGVIPCEGGMHLLMSVFSAIGYLYGDAGLKQLLYESGVYAAGSAEHMLSGKDFDRALHGLRLVDEVLNRRFLLHFKRWCDDNKHIIPDQISQLLSHLTEDDSIISVTLQLTNVVIDKLSPLIQLFRDHGRSVSPTFKFWDDFLMKVMLPLKVFLSTTRNGLWHENQKIKAEFLPLLFATNHINYARYLPVSLLLMNRLPPEVVSAFEEGSFVAKLSHGRFNAVWMDYTLETTENKALKGTGGIIGLTLKGPALARWFFARPVTAQYSTRFQDGICNAGQKKKDTQAQYHAGGTTDQKRWNTDIGKMTQMFEGAYIDPFDMTTTHLVNFATGAVAPPLIAESMGNALVKGATMASAFIADRLILPEGADTPKKSLYDPISRSTIKTMSDMRRKVKVHHKDVTIDGEVMYLRLLAVNATKKVPLKRLLSFENAPVPLSLFADDGTMLSCAKSDFMHKLEELIPHDKVTEIQRCDALVIDGHASIQMLGVPMTTGKMCFRGMAERFIGHIMHISSTTSSNDVQQIHIVFDKYLEDSIKGQTRAKRGDDQGHLYHVKADVAIPQNWKQFLSKGQNKANLAQYYTEYIMECTPASLKKAQTLFTSGGKDDKAFSITTERVIEVDSLSSNQEEADTRIVLHSAAAAENGAQTVVVHSPDTDVLVLLVHHRPAIKAKEIFFMTGREGKHTQLTRYIPVHTIYDLLSMEQQKILLSVYCLTGCDTVSSFFGHGKRTAYRLMMQKADQFQTLALLGSSQKSVVPEVEQSAMKFVGAMYGKSGCVSLNALRCEKTGKKNIQGKKLPPTEDAFHLHLLRCAYQLLIWRQAIVPMATLPDVTTHGYERCTGLLQPQMMSQSPAAPELLNDLVCDCLPGGCAMECSCLANQQPCTAACDCFALADEEEDLVCVNPMTLSTLDSDTSDSDPD